MNVIDRSVRLERAMKAQYLATDSKIDMNLYLDACFMRYALTEHLSYSELDHSRYWQKQKARHKQKGEKYGIDSETEAER